MYAFDARYDELEAQDAERAFLRRSTKELRWPMTLASFVVLPSLLVLALYFDAPTWVVVLLSVVLAASFLGPLFFYFARPAEAGRLARKFPVRHFELGPTAVEVTAGGEKAAIPWARVRQVWNAGNSVLLVLSPYFVVAIPRQAFPEGAYDYLLAVTKTPPNKSLERTREG
jgi:multidrug efflux pump subunit AcrB